MNLEQCYREVDGLEASLIRTRRDFHRFAESGWREFRTTAIIIHRLRSYGYEVILGKQLISEKAAWARPQEAFLQREQQRAISQGADPDILPEMQGFTGAAVVLETGKPGPVIALRFDMDCNDLSESCEASHRPYAEGFASLNENQMHACGHDGHTAIGLAVAEILSQHRNELCGKVKLIFQPAEEGDRGASAIVDSGILNDVDVVLAAHIYNSPEGRIGLAGTQTGLFATTKFDVTIHGKSAHAGAAPQEGSNAVTAACFAVTGMQAFLQDGRGSSRLNIGTIRGGSGRNVISQVCRMEAETRGSDTVVEQRLYQRALATVSGVCEAFGCSFNTEIRGICPAGSGDLNLAERIAERAKSVPGIDYTIPALKQTGGTDDFTCMMDAVRAHGGQACYMGLLTPIAAGHHNSLFDFDERILAAGVKVFLTSVDMLMK